MAAELAPVGGLSMRQIKRVLLRVELALLCYREVPVDAPALVSLAFWPPTLAAHSSLTRPLLENDLRKKFLKTLPRFQLKWRGQFDFGELKSFEELLPTYLTRDKIAIVAGVPVSAKYSSDNPKLFGLPPERYRMGIERASGHDIRWRVESQSFDPVLAINNGLAPWYIPEHQAMLDAVHHLAAD